jgi:hypothetical protein
MVGGLRTQQGRIEDVEQALGLLLAEADAIERSSQAALDLAARVKTASRRARAAGRQDLASLTLGRHRRATAELDNVAAVVQQVGDAVGSRVAELELELARVSAAMARVPDRLRATERLLRATLDELPVWFGSEMPPMLGDSAGGDGEPRKNPDPARD